MVVDLDKILSKETCSREVEEGIVLLVKYLRGLF